MSDTLETRTARLETVLVGLAASVARIEAKLDRINERLDTVLVEIAELGGRVSQLPSTRQWRSASLI
jgi:uncharacterized coiled-coil protein SlyX